MWAWALLAVSVAGPRWDFVCAQQGPQYFTIQELRSPEMISTGPITVRRLTLEEAKQMALGNNKALALAHLNIDEKRYATAAVKKDYLPKFIGSETYFHFDNPLGTVLTTRGGLTFSADVVNQDAALTTAFVAQPITKLIAVNAAVQADRADESIAKAKLDKGTKDLLSGVAQVYYGLVGACGFNRRCNCRASYWSSRSRRIRRRNCESLCSKFDKDWFRCRARYTN